LTSYVPGLRVGWHRPIPSHPMGQVFL
jgi:hypothetical protein